MNIPIFIVYYYFIVQYVIILYPYICFSQIYPIMGQIYVYIRGVT